MVPHGVAAVSFVAGPLGIVVAIVVVWLPLEIVVGIVLDGPLGIAEAGPLGIAVLP